MTPSEYEALRPFATIRQQEHIDALVKYGSQRKAAAGIGVSARKFAESLARLQKKAALQGHSPAHDMTHTAPDGFKVKGVSTYYDDEGKVRGQWVKTTQDQERQLAIMQEVVSALCEDIRGAAVPVKAPTNTNSESMATYCVGDAHVGLYAWGQECGEDHDCDIAQRDLIGAMNRLVDSAPATDKAMIVNVGDWYHTDTMENRTRQSNAALDVDTRWARVIRIGIMIMRHMVDKALAKHKKVVVVNANGNHDQQSSVMLSIALAMYYEREPRVEIDQSPAKFRYHRFGSNLIGITHGDTIKLDQLGEVMAVDRPADWGETLHRVWLTGHIHHKTVWELRGCTVESFRTLAAKDAWHTGQGYRSQRDMVCIVLHERFGETERHTANIQRVRDS